MHGHEDKEQPANRPPSKLLMAERPVSLPLSTQHPALSTQNSLPLVEEWFPCSDPWIVLQALAWLPRAICCDSALAQPGLGRFSFLSADLYEWLWSRGRQAFLSDESGDLES